MAKNCLVCGKNIGLLTARVPLIEEDESIVICADCFDKMPPILSELYIKSVCPNKTELATIKEEVIQQLKITNYNQATIDFIIKYFDYKIERAKEAVRDANGNLLKKCPICKKSANYDAEFCSDCGFSFKPVPAIDYNEIAKIHNARYEQYKKNAFYEYDYVVVQNKADGSTDEERIKEIMASHAMQGWRLIIMYSNELGKNSVGLTIAGIGGVTNSTICEDVMVFERCIKREE